MTEARVPVRPLVGYPDRRDHDQRWSGLARAIAARRADRTDDPAAIGPIEAPGRLIVIGSGIETVGFTTADEILLRDADQVFYCVADPATTVWLKSLRPDAYDLYVLYGEDKKRYVTYMQMTEAMLHYVRQGQTVVAVYYGHPGVFVLSTHRAIQIARREGHSAVMRAAVSALDTLCADLGIDPSQPGLQTFEATDMLIRRRRPDPSMHLVLWQVGLIGELGYRRQGFLNQGFALLLDYLEEFYGADHPVINYVGSRYPGIEPVIERHTVASLRQPSVQRSVTGISTFYLAPQDVVGVDHRVLEQLGLIRPGQHVSTPASPLRVIDRYGPREMKAFDDLAAFAVPEAYQWQEDTPAARFVLALRESPDLQARYAVDAEATVAAWPDPRLEPGDRSLLATRDAGAVQIAAKGLRVETDPQIVRMLAQLLTRKTLARDLLRHVRRAGPGCGEQALASWSEAQGFAVTWGRVPYEIGRFVRRFLSPWTGVYLRSKPNQCIVVAARSRRLGGNQILVDGEKIIAARYKQGVLRWMARNGNSTSGYLQTDMSTGGRRLIGSIWPAGQSAASPHRMAVHAHPLPIVAEPAATALDLLGNYRLRVTAPHGNQIVDLELRDGSLLIGGRPVGSSSRDSGSWRWQQGPAELPEGDVRGLVDPLTRRPMIFGTARTGTGPARSSVAGIMPVDPAHRTALLAEPQLGLPDWAWPQVAQTAIDAVDHGGLFLWQSWQASVSCLQMVRAAIREAAL